MPTEVTTLLATRLLTKLACVAVLGVLAVACGTQSSAPERVSAQQDAADEQTTLSAPTAVETDQPEPVDTETVQPAVSTTASQVDTATSVPSATLSTTSTSATSTSTTTTSTTAKPLPQPGSPEHPHRFCGEPPAEAELVWGTAGGLRDVGLCLSAAFQDVGGIVDFSINRPVVRISLANVTSDALRFQLFGNLQVAYEWHGRYETTMDTYLTDGVIVNSRRPIQCRTDVVVDAGYQSGFPLCIPVDRLAGITEVRVRLRDFGGNEFLSHWNPGSAFSAVEPDPMTIVQ